MTSSPTAYPEGRAERNSWIVARRGPRNQLDPMRPYAFFVEEETSSTGESVPVATIFLTNRECPWRCLMCDLWKNTLGETGPVGAIAAQIRYALERLPPARQIKLYNSGSFFDKQAIHYQEHIQIAAMLATFERVIVESHPALIGESCFAFHRLVTGRLEVAMGLETAHADILQRLNKQMTLDDFAAAAERLRQHGIALRVFILVKPPFMQEEEALHWAKRSLDFAFDCGASAATLIPTRAGNGALDELAMIGDFAPPRLATVEAAATYGLSLHRGRVFIDLWEVDNRDRRCTCHEARKRVMQAMNLQQVAIPSVACDRCEAIG